MHAGWPIEESQVSYPPATGIHSGLRWAAVPTCVISASHITALFFPCLLGTYLCKCGIKLSPSIQPLNGACTYFTTQPGIYQGDISYWPLHLPAFTLNSLPTTDVRVNQTKNQTKSVEVIEITNSYILFLSSHCGQLLAQYIFEFPS